MKTREFRHWLEAEYLQRSGKPPAAESVQSSVQQTQGDDALLAAVIEESMTKTEREALVKSRIGQDAFSEFGFRNLELSLCGHR